MSLVLFCGILVIRMKYFLLIATIILTISAFVLFGGQPQRRPAISGAGSTGALQETPSVTTITHSSGPECIRLFFSLITQGNIPEAISMMDEHLTPSDTEKQIYGTVFNSFAHVDITDIQEEQFGKDTLDEGETRYKVMMNLAIKPDGQSGMWEEGDTVRWITLKTQKDSGRCVVYDIATGP